MKRTRLRGIPCRRCRELYRGIGVQFRDYRADTGAAQAAIARAAGMTAGHLSRIEGGLVDASLGSLEAVAHALGGEITLRFRPGTGPLVRDHFQGAMLQGFLPGVHARWRRLPEVPIYRPSPGWIDLVLADPLAGIIIACEFHSLLLRLEQTLRWGRTKAEQLRSSGTVPFAEEATTSQLLVLRSTPQTRRVAKEFDAVLAAAYPARTADAVAALTTEDAPWPGSAVVWMDVQGGRARLLPRPPRGIALGR